MTTNTSSAVMQRRDAMQLAISEIRREVLPMGFGRVNSDMVMEKSLKRVADIAGIGLSKDLAVTDLSREVDELLAGAGL